MSEEAKPGKPGGRASRQKGDRTAHTHTNARNSHREESEHSLMFKAPVRRTDIARHQSPLQEVAKLLFPVNTLASLTNALGVKKGTARAWMYGTRRMPFAYVTALHELLKSHYTDAGHVLHAMKAYVRQREFEPPRRLTGCCSPRYRKLRRTCDDYGAVIRRE